MSRGCPGGNIIIQRVHFERVRPVGGHGSRSAHRLLFDERTNSAYSNYYLSAAGNANKSLSMSPLCFPPAGRDRSLSSPACNHHPSGQLCSYARLCAPANPIRRQPLIASSPVTHARTIYYVCLIFMPHERITDARGRAKFRTHCTEGPRSLARSRLNATTTTHRCVC